MNAPDLAARAFAVRKRFGAVGALGDAEHGVDLEARFGEITALVGPNGAGKSTLLRILGGVLAPDAGSVRVLGRDDPALAVDRELRARRAYVAQEPALDPDLTGRETLRLLATLHGVPRREREARIVAVADAFDLLPHLDRRVGARRGGGRGGWSGGMKRRLHLAVGLVHDPDLLLLDEPTSGLDPEGRAFLWAELARRARAGRAVVLVTHDLDAVGRHADVVAVLDSGRVAAVGPPGNLLSRLVRGAAGQPGSLSAEPPSSSSSK